MHTPPAASSPAAGLLSSPPALNGYCLAGPHAQIVMNDLSEIFQAQGSPVLAACDSVQGLSRAYAYPRVRAATDTRYTQAEGYWFNPYWVPGIVRIQVADANASATQIEMGGVVVLNAQGFDIANEPVTDTFEVGPGRCMRAAQLTCLLFATCNGIGCCIGTQGT